MRNRRIPHVDNNELPFFIVPPTTGNRKGHIECFPYSFFPSHSNSSPIVSLVRKL